MSQITSPRELFLHELGDILYVEKKLADVEVWETRVSELERMLGAEKWDPEAEKVEAEAKRIEGDVEDVEDAEEDASSALRIESRCAYGRREAGWRVAGGGMSSIAALQRQTRVSRSAETEGNGS